MRLGSEEGETRTASSMDSVQSKTVGTVSPEGEREDENSESEHETITHRLVPPASASYYPFHFF